MRWIVTDFAPSCYTSIIVWTKSNVIFVYRVAAECTNDASWVERYQFVADRLRAVRQDMVIQNLPVHDSIEILEPIVRFHCYSSYRWVNIAPKSFFMWYNILYFYICRLCEESIDNFDPKLNSTHLQECLKRLLVLYDYVQISDGEEAKKSLKNQSEIEVLYLTVNLGDVNAIGRALERNRY